MKSSNLSKCTKIYGLILGLLLINFESHAQNGNITGYVRDKITNQPLIGATITIENTSLGAVTDISGFFEIENIPTKTYTLTANYLGYKSFSKFNLIIKSAGNVLVNFYLEEASEALKGVSVISSPFEKYAETPLSLQRLSPEEIATYPGGNNDVAKVVQSLPGVSGAVGGFRNDVIIRGGAPNENVYYLDGIEIPNINHFSTQGSAGGPVGLLNVSFIEGVSLSTSAFHARYDNPLSGVLQFDQRTGNAKKFQGNIRVSASETALTAEGPLLKKGAENSNTTYIISARRSYLQFLFKAIGLPILPDYWDYQYKIHHKIDDYNEIYITGIGAIDDFSVNIPDDIDANQQSTLDQVPIINQTSTTVGVNWKRRFQNNKGFMNTSLSTNILNNNFKQFADNESETGLFFENDAKEQEQKLRYEITNFVKDWTISTGITLQRAIYDNNTRNDVDNIQYNSSIDLVKYGFHIQTSTQLMDKKLSLAIGFRADGNDFITQKNQIFKTLSPRVALSYKLDESEKWQINATVGRYNKLPPYTILGFRDNGNTLVNKTTKYISSNHFVIGIEHLLNASTRISLEGFYKKYDNYPVSRLDGISLANKGADFEVLGNEEISSIGEGKTLGIELLYQQKLSKNFYGILAYTLFQSEFSGVDGRFLPSLWDSRHLLTFTGGYKFGTNWEISLRHRFIGNTPYIPVDESATLQFYPAIILDYNRLGELKLGNFNQADIRIDKKWNFNKVALDVYLEIQNAFNQQIPQPPTYGLNRDSNGAVVDPRTLIVVEDDNASVLPIIGLVLDF